MTDPKPEELSKKQEVNWITVVIYLQIILPSLVSLYFVFYEAKIVTTFFAVFLAILGALGQNAGAHRLWAHKSYTANLPLKLFLIICQTMGNDCSIYNWVRYHRLHHKFFKTDLDPYNPSKGFWYSHFYAHVLNLSPAQEKALEEIDMSDLENDRLIKYQHKYFWGFYLILACLLPINAPAEYWGESILSSLFVLGFFRLAINRNMTHLLHSGTNIFDLGEESKNTYDSNLIFIINKTYWLSYHYLNPSDYQTGEYGKYGTDCTSKFIRVCAALEYATNLKTINSQMVRTALENAVDSDKSVSEFLNEYSERPPVEHFLTPSKFL